MSPTTGAPGTIRHPDVSEISDLAEGLLSPTRSAEVRRHLDDCALCADVRASLEEIRGLLGTLPGPARMPADIAGRIDAALAAEALLGRTSPPAARPQSEPAPRRVSRETSPTRPARTAPAGRPGSATGPGRNRARRRMAALGALAAAAACVLGIYLTGGFPSGEAGHDAATKQAPSAAADQSHRAAGSFTAEGLQGNVRQLLTGAATGETQGEKGEKNTFGADGTSPQPGLVAPEGRSAAAVPQCVRAGTGRTEAPLAAERGTFQGTEVYLLVLPHPGDLAKVDAFLIGTACENTPGKAAGEPLLTETYPRP
ncbi:anti-sigma factor [Streptomyces sp. NPDC002054]|uniref:anti-sigma factor family protein n=1 Tax=Streptomyces sp. NPDC002054 TaxID=3154663 RepID=UPI00332AFBC6